MNVIVLGLWHLGSVTAACLAKHHRVIGLDFDESGLAQLRTGHAPLHEPGLDDLLAAGLATGRLEFSSDAAAAIAADVLWVCYDTPVDADDRSDLDWVHTRLARVLPRLRPGTVVLLSSQLPVGTCSRLAQQHPTLHFACSPENLRLGKAIEAFEKPARIIVGVSSAPARDVLEKLLAPLGAPLVWMRPESAEMVKHALNSFLALSVAYINEVAALSETVGADAQEVAAGLKSDPRIGSRAYLGPGGPFAGGTLARDVVTLTRLGAAQNVPLALIPAIKESNDRHRSWAFRKLQSALAGVAQPVVAVLGLAYTPNTSTLRRSAAVELCRQLLATGFKVQAFDPLIRTADADHRDLPLVVSPADALRGAHAAVICTEWPEFRDYAWPSLLAAMSRPVIVDANRLVEKAVAGAPGIVYLTVGRP
ncbi:MAG TPA: nucleotide sugar dehydrogenase [Lacunisphaera sp.]|nr:nucleotide sugar dehydrogenase [Lacunisphaera sp.]